MEKHTFFDQFIPFFMNLRDKDQQVYTIGFTIADETHT